MCFGEKRVAVLSPLTSVSLSHLGGDLGLCVLVTVFDGSSLSSSGSRLTSASSSSSSKRRRLRKETLLLLAPFDRREECNDWLVLLKLVSSEALTVSPHCSITQESKSPGSRHWTKPKPTKKNISRGKRRGGLFSTSKLCDERERSSVTHEWLEFLFANVDPICITRWRWHTEILFARRFAMNTYIRLERSMRPLSSLGARNEERVRSWDALLMPRSSILQGRIEHSNLLIELYQSNRLTVRIRGEKFLLSIDGRCRRRKVQFARTKLVSRSLIALHEIFITKWRGEAHSSSLDCSFSSMNLQESRVDLNEIFIGQLSRMHFG